MELVKFLEDNNLLASQQHGFRKGRSTVTQLLEYYEKICKAIEDRTNLDTVYLDFAKAFDKADYGIAAHRMKELGIGGELGVWLVSFLTNRRQQVIANNKISSVKFVKSGVPQGSILGPVIFLMIIDSITALDPDNKLGIFADDTKVSHFI